MVAYLLSSAQPKKFHIHALLILLVVLLNASTGSIISVSAFSPKLVSRTHAKKFPHGVILDNSLPPPTVHPKHHFCRNQHTRLSSFLASFTSSSSSDDDTNDGVQQRPMLGIEAMRPSIETGCRYTSGDWFNNIRSLPNSYVLGRIKYHLMFNTVLSLAVVLVNKYLVPVSIPCLGHTLLGSFLGLLLVFRTDSAYTRFWQGRQLWSNCKETCRKLAMTCATQLQDNSPKAANRILELLTEFPDALAFTCLSGDISLTDRIKHLVPSHLHNDPAIGLCLMMQHQLLAATKENPEAGLNICEARYHMEASDFIQALVDTTTKCECIVRTPVPWSYSRHLSRFLTIWSGTLPFALVAIFGWLTLPVMMVVCWGLFSIEEIGHLIEQPFVADGDEVESAGVLSKTERMELKSKTYDTGIPVEQLAWMISGQVGELVQGASQLPKLQKTRAVAIA